MISPTHPNTFTNLCGSLPPGTAWFPVLLLCEWNSCGETKGFDEPWGQNKSNNSEKHLTKMPAFTSGLVMLTSLQKQGRRDHWQLRSMHPITPICTFYPCFDKVTPLVTCRNPILNMSWSRKPWLLKLEKGNLNPCLWKERTYIGQRELMSEQEIRDCQQDEKQHQIQENSSGRSGGHQ